MAGEGANPAIVQVADILRPRLSELIEYLNDQQETMASVFFTEVLIGINTAHDEEQLLAAFINLSNAAFLGFQYDEKSWEMADAILMEAQNVAHAFSASGDAH